MKVKFIAFFIAMTFLAFLTAPTAIALFDIDYDTAILFNTNEEEEENESKESLKEIEIKSDLNPHFNGIAIITIKPSSTYFYLKSYTPNTLELASPPPEELS